MIASFALVVVIPNSSYAEEDPFPGVNDGAEVSARQPINPRTGDPADGSAPIVCPAGSGRSQVANATTREQYLVCVKNWRPSSAINNDKDFRDRQDAARAAAEAESKAWNAANPGKQKCVQWGPIVHANGVSTASGGVCANPVEPGPGTTVKTQDAPSVSAPTSSTPSSSTSSTGNPTSSTSDASSNASSTSAPTSSVSGTTQSSAVEYFPQWGSGSPYTRVLKGQLSTSECPTGFQGANGLIVAIGSGTFTECWPENAWAAYRLGGSVWEQFKSSGGSYDAKAEETRRNKVAELKALAKSVAQKAADETPGIQRCSTWTGYGETGQECAFTFIKPNESTSTAGPQAAGSSNTSDSATATSNTTQSTSVATTSSNSSGSSGNSSDPFPSLKNGEEIPGTRISSEPGVSQATWESTSTFRNSSCPAGSGRAAGVDLRGTLTNSDDVWYSYCVKSWFAVTTIQSETATMSSSGGSGSTSITPTVTSSSSTSETATAVAKTETATAVTSSAATATGTQAQGSSSSATTPESSSPTLTTSAINVSGSSNQVRELIAKVVDSEREQRAMVGLVNALDRVLATLTTKTVRLPSSRSVQESATSETPDTCKVEGLSVIALKRGSCVINYEIVDSDGNTFTTKKTFTFRR